MIQRYDWHIHSCLSPCADNDITPANIVGMAQVMGLDCIALTDHNTCLNCPALFRAAKGTELTVLAGMELCTMEEIHVVCLFAELDNALRFSEYVATTLPPVKNRPDVFGDQLIVDENDEIVGTVDILLNMASGISVDDVPSLVEQFGGVAFPAHIDRPSYSIIAALGDIPPLGFTAYEVSQNGDPEALAEQYPQLRSMKLLRDSDSHSLESLAGEPPALDIPDVTPTGILRWLAGKM